MSFTLFSRYQKKKAGDHTAFLRKNSVDAEVFEYVFVEKYHRPYKALTAAKPVILDLGSNIGLTIMDFKTLYPGATIYAYELDGDNFQLSQKNCRGLSDCYIYNKAIWTDSNGIQYKKDVAVDAYKAESAENTQTGMTAAPSITIAGIVKDHGIERIDYVKMDIEGAEYNIFESDLSWLERTDQIKIEVHFDESKFPFFKDKLSRYGFETVKDTHHWSTLIGYRK